MIDPVAGASVGRFRVLKKIAVTSRGAIKLARQHGTALVCVRYRVDDDGKYRYTTVELVVERAAIRPSGATMVDVKAWLLKDSPALRFIKSAGAVWNADTMLWRMKRRVAIEAGLEDRIVGSSRRHP